MKNESQILMEQLVNTIKRSQEYNQYQNLLVSIKRQPEIYQRIGEFRRRSMAFQMSDHVNHIEANNELQKEFDDLRTNGLANEFMAAEHQYCQMIQGLQNDFLEQIDLNIDFLDY